MNEERGNLFIGICACIMQLNKVQSELPTKKAMHMTSIAIECMSVVVYMFVFV